MAHLGWSGLTIGRVAQPLKSGFCDKEPTSEPFFAHRAAKVSVTANQLPLLDSGVADIAARSHSPPTCRSGAGRNPA